MRPEPIWYAVVMLVITIACWKSAMWDMVILGAIGFFCCIATVVVDYFHLRAKQKEKESQPPWP